MAAAKFPITWPKHHVHVRNELGGGKQLLVHCKSADNDLQVHYLSIGEEFSWHFKAEVLIAHTLFWCYLAPDGGHHASFDAWTEDIGRRYEVKHNSLFWIARDDGVHLNKNVFWMHWKQGRRNEGRKEELLIDRNMLLSK
ncbi:unnamed protein product [Linum trigynum]